MSNTAKKGSVGITDCIYDVIISHSGLKQLTQIKVSSLEAFLEFKFLWCVIGLGSSNCGSYLGMWISLWKMRFYKCHLFALSLHHSYFDLNWKSLHRIRWHCFKVLSVNVLTSNYVVLRLFLRTRACALPT